jgi:hypothetical protein
MYLKKLIVAVCATLMLPGAALGQHGGYGHGGGGHGDYGHGGGYGHGGFGHGGGPPPGFHGGHFAPGPVGHFGPHDLSTWRGGYWWHGWRGGRVGWWWFAGGFWYWYATPVYPFPDYVPDDWVGGYPAPGSVWWFCDNPPGYYPYVQGCWHWRPVAPNGAPYYPPP